MKRSTTLGGAAALLLSVAILLAPATSRGQPAAAPADAPAAPTEGSTATPEEGARSEAVAEASQRFQRGLELYQDGDHALALIEFERAYELVPNYRVLYNIGQVSIQLNRYARARKALEEYLREGGTEVPEARRAQVQADIDMLKRRTAFITIGTNQPGAEISLDQVPVGESPLGAPLLVDAGEHAVSARKPGFRTRFARVTLAGGDSSMVNLELLPQEAKPTIVYERRVESKVIEKDRRAAGRGWLIAGWATTGLLATGAAVSGVLGRSAVNDLHEERQTQTTSTELKQDQTRARTLLAVADGLTVGALAIGGMSLYATLRRSPRNRKVTSLYSADPQPGARYDAHRRTCLKLAIGPRSVAVTGSF